MGAGPEALQRRVRTLHQANERLRRSEERFRTLIESAPDAVLGVDVRGRIQLVNARTEELFGYSREELMDGPVEMLLPVGLRAAHVSQRLGYLRNPEPRLMGANREVTALRKDGSECRVAINLAMIHTEDGPIVMASVRDISDRVRADTERVLLETQLQQAQRLESIGQLAGGVAHDFNNLLMVISNYAEWALERLGDEHPVRSDVEEIRRAAERAAALTRQLLIFSRREVVRPEVLDLNGVVRDMENLLRRTIGEHIILTTSLSSEPMTAYVDPGEMEQVVMNLAVNSRDAMPDGGRLQVEVSAVTIEGEQWPGLDAPPGEYVRLAVTDSGVGMQPDVMDRALEPFFTTKPRGQGTGLGLSTVYGIAMQAGGNVKLYSEPGRGSTVAVYLPRADAVPMVRHAAAGGTLRGEGERILLVEDEDAVREIAARILREHGYEVFTASSGSDAIELWNADGDHVDAVVTDVVMPGMSGRELSERIRAIRPDVAILFMSGYPSDFLSDDVGDDERTVLLRKPFGQAALLSAIRRALERGRRDHAESLADA